MILTVVLLALGVFALVNLAKFFLTTAVRPAGKLTIVAVVSGLVVVPFAMGPREGVLLGLGVFGLSTVFHGLHKLLEAAGDAKRSETLSMRR